MDTQVTFGRRAKDFFDCAIEESEIAKHKRMSSDRILKN
jgi:hypothetical protein